MTETLQVIADEIQRWITNTNDAFAPTPYRSGLTYAYDHASRIVEEVIRAQPKEPIPIPAAVLKKVDPQLGHQWRVATEQGPAGERPVLRTRCSRCRMTFAAFWEGRNRDRCSPPSEDVVESIPET